MPSSVLAGTICMKNWATAKTPCTAPPNARAKNNRSRDAAPEASIMATSTPCERRNICSLPTICSGVHNRLMTVYVMTASTGIITGRKRRQSPCGFRRSVRR